MTYDYECPNCGNVIEISRKISDPEEDYDCPKCSTTLMRKYNSTPVIFNARGFYSTDK